jgi:hypothetical protein
MRRALGCPIPFLLSACGGLTPAIDFAPIGEVLTTARRELAEGGHGAPVPRPDGLSWSSSLAGYGPAAETAQPRYELRLTLLDAAAPVGSGVRSRPMPASTRLADDLGGVYPCRVVREAEAPSKRAADAPAQALYTLDFEVPPAYRFAAVVHVTVHWELQLPDGSVLPISTRFRAI